MGFVAIPAPAKINLFLHITGKRDDNYSLLESLVVFTEYGDEILVTEADGLRLEISGIFGHELSKTKLEDNLVIKAALALQHFSGKSPGANIKLVKNLPIASGIGGGSSDAAATLHALIELWKIDISSEELARIAIKLGSDIPVCLYGKPALMSGIGEEIKEVSLKENPYIVLINPNTHIATADIFKDFWKMQPTLSEACGTIEFSITEIADEKKYSNYLQSSAIARLPVIEEIIKTLNFDPNCLVARMSGSGATCFGLYNDKASSENARKKLQELYPQSWCVNTVIK